MILLIIVGLVLLLLGIYLAMPAPLPVIFKIIGIVLLVWGGILLLLYLLHGSAGAFVPT
jgi:hypothetical protein